MKCIYVLVFFLIPLTLLSSAEQIFTDIYEQNAWHNAESVSGPGSTHKETYKIRQAIPLLLEAFQITSLLDAPCGDFNWFRLMDLPTLEQYIGVDVVQDLIQANQKYANDKRMFLHKDILIDELPTVDLILCRDCLVHFPYAEIWQALKNCKKSGARYLLTTTFPGCTTNKNLSSMGRWRPLNLQHSPFNFPEPLVLIKEEIIYNNPVWCTKSLALWRFDQLPID